MFRLVPRKYRNLVIRIFAVALCLVFLYLMQSSSPADSGAGREDQPLFRFDDDTNGLEEYDAIRDQELEAVAPKRHRGHDFEGVANKESNNVTEPPLIEPEVFQYFADDELKPWFERPWSDPSSPGELGQAVRVDGESQEIKDLVKEGWQKHAFNHYVCEKISLHRSLGDKRDRECIERRWKKPLPSTSVIIIFHNEAWCTLLRTVHSVLETSPKVALKEVLLVDDASTHEDLGSKLDDYVKALEIVKVLRLPHRGGLVRARLVGAEAATGEVLTFLDSHCECGPHWLEPLLERISEDPTRVVCPVIEVINAETFAMGFTPARSIQRGIMSLALVFSWGGTKSNPPAHKAAYDGVLGSATMAGGLFAINREYFYHLGSYDAGMQIWGSENIEMSIRIWTCGGSLEIHPCSHVGHVFRKHAPYTHPGGDDVMLRNNRRVAEVWMDEYKEQYYRRVPRALKVDAGDLTERIELRKRLKCNSFQWFLDNVIPQLYVLPEQDVLHEGEWHNEHERGVYCLDSANPAGTPGLKVITFPCHGAGSNQDFIFTKQGEIRHVLIRQLCLQASGQTVVANECNYPQYPVPKSQTWTITRFQQIMNQATYRCMEAQRSVVYLLPCRDIPAQRWVPKKLGS